MNCAHGGTSESVIVDGVGSRWLPSAAASPSAPTRLAPLSTAEWHFYWRLLSLRLPNTKIFWPQFHCGQNKISKSITWFSLVSSGSITSGQRSRSRFCWLRGINWLAREACTRPVCAMLASSEQSPNAWGVLIIFFVPRRARRSKRQSPAAGPSAPGSQPPVGWEMLKNGSKWFMNLLCWFALDRLTLNILGSGVKICNSSQSTLTSCSWMVYGCKLYILFATYYRSWNVGKNSLEKYFTNALNIFLFY